MKSSTTRERIAGGIDQRHVANERSATSIVNMSRDPEGFGWTNSRGWELESKPNSSHTAPAPNTIAAHRSRLFVWTRHRGSEVYKIWKDEYGYLHYEHGNSNGAGSGVYPFTHKLNEVPRTIAKSDDPDEQYVPFGRFLIIVNGKDVPLKFWGRDKVEPFGFTKTTPAPTLLPPDADYWVGSCDMEADPPTSSYPGSVAGKVALSFSSPLSAGGLGLHAQDEKVNNYAYSITFITNTGSESPLSKPVPLQWQNPEDNGLRTYGVFIESLPTGPPGTVARRIYRTKCMGDLRNDGRDAKMYLVTQIDDNCTLNYMDVVPDDLLITDAPADTDSTIISTSYRFAANWDNRTWLAGGQGNETKIIYSAAGLPEQFGTFNYFEVGNRAGGAITQIFPYYDNLLVFRQNAIDVIRPAGNGTYVSTRLSGEVGTTASNTITNIQGLGLFFLSYDGVYRFRGGTVGGSSVSLEPVSDEVQKEYKRISKSSLARATAAYSHKEKEWWAFYPVDGNTENTRSLVFHTQDGVWSLRHSIKKASERSYFDVNTLTTLPDGSFVAGFRPTIETGPTSSTAYPGGLCVWSGCRQRVPGVEYSGVALFGTQEGGGILSEWASSWEDLGDDSTKKRILSVEVEMLSSGNNEINLFSATDYRLDFTDAGSNPTNVAEEYGSTNSDALLSGTGPTTPYNSNKLVIGSGSWGERRVTRVRWDVNTGLVSWFMFKLQSTNSFQIVSYQINYVGGAKKTINMKAGQR